MAELNRERSEIGTDHLASVSPEYSLYTYLAGPLRDQVGVGDGLDDPHCTPAGESFPRTSDKGVSTVKFLLVGERGFLLVLLLSFFLSFLSFPFFISFFLSFLPLPSLHFYIFFPPFLSTPHCSFTVFILNFTVFRLFRFVIVFYLFSSQTISNQKRAPWCCSHTETGPPSRCEIRPMTRHGCSNLAKNPK